MIIYWTVDSTRRWITAALAATKLKTLLTHHISEHGANIYGTIMHHVDCRPITYTESYRRIFIILSVDTIHVRQSLEMRLLTSTYSTVMNKKNIVDINIILHTSQYSRSKQDHIQQSTLEVLEYRFYRIWSCDDGVYIGMLGYHWMIKVVIPWTSHNNKHNWICHRSAIKKGGKWWINTIGIYEGCIRRIATWKS